MKHFHFRPGALAALAALLLAAAGCKQTVSIPSSAARNTETRSAGSFIKTAHYELVRQDMAVHALLATLIDDADLPHFTTEPDTPLFCAEATSVRVNGAPLEPGAEVPLAAFTLDFDLFGACPLGLAGPRLTGSLQMLVVHDDEEGLAPVVLQQL
jgi:hypothetical protein